MTPKKKNTKFTIEDAEEPYGFVFDAKVSVMIDRKFPGCCHIDCFHLHPHLGDKGEDHDVCSLFDEEVAYGYHRSKDDKVRDIAGRGCWKRCSSCQRLLSYHRAKAMYKDGRGTTETLSIVIINEHMGHKEDEAVR